MGQTEETPAATRRRGCILVGGVSLAVSILCMVWIYPVSEKTGWSNFAIEDSWMYATMAEMFDRHGVLYDGEDFDSYARFRSPAYPVFILGLQKLESATGWPWRMLLTVSNGIFYAWACVILYRLTAEMTTEAIGRVAGCFLAVCPSVPYSLALMPESMSLAAWLGSQALLLRGLRRSSPALLAWSGAALGLAALAKPLFFYSIAVNAIVIAGSLRGQWRKALVGGAIHVAVFAVAVFPWYVRNYIVWKEWLFTPNGGTHLYHFVRPMLLEQLGQPIDDPTQKLNRGFLDPRVPRTTEEWEQKFGSSWFNLARRNAVLGTLAIEDIKQHVGDFVIMCAKKHPRLYLGTGTRAMADMDGEPKPPEDFRKVSTSGQMRWLIDSGWWIFQAVTWLILALVYVTALWGCFAAWRQHWNALLFWSLGQIVFLAAMIGPFQSTRYRFPMMAPLAALAAVGAVNLFQRARRRRTARLQPSPSPIN